MKKLFSNKIAIAALLLVLAGAIAYAAGVFKPKPPPEPKKIGILLYVLTLSPIVDGFKEGMAELGYVEGEDIVYTPVAGSFNPKDMAVFAKQQLEEEDVDVFLAVTTVAAKAALDLTAETGRTDIPVVFTNGVNALQAGIIKDRKSSGNNSTGVEVNFPDVTAKKLEFLKRIDPTIEKIGVIHAAHGDISTTFLRPAFEAAALKAGLEIVRYNVDQAPPEGIEKLKQVLQSIQPGEIDAYFQMTGPIRDETGEIAMTKRLGIPSVWINLPTVEANGGLFAYEHDHFEEGKQTAIIMDKVLKGTKPADIPIEFPKKHSLWLNMKTARETGLTFPESMIQLADKIIEEEAN